MTRATPRQPRRTFGTTWWGRAWIDALEQRARLDPNRLPRGRTYARRGRVGPLQVESGSLLASVQGSRVEPYQVRVRVRVLSDGEWDRLLDTVASHAGYTAALLDGELPPEVVADAASAGVELLPGAGEVGPRCSCPDWADPCKHAAAVVYLVADVLDNDPFALLRLRGRSRDEVLAALRQRRIGGTTRRQHADAPAAGRPPDEGVVARDAYVAADDGPPPLPAVPLPPRQPGAPAALAVDPPVGTGVRSQDLTALAADAARRAWELSLGEGDGGLDMDPLLDLVRRMAPSWGEPGQPELTEVAARAGLRPVQLGRLLSAWQLGGADAITVLDEVWDPEPEAVEEARTACAGLGSSGHRSVHVRGNRLTVAGVGPQLRLSRSGGWYRFDRSGRGWALTEGPSPDPAVLVRTAAGPSN